VLLLPLLTGDWGRKVLLVDTPANFGVINSLGREGAIHVCSCRHCAEEIGRKAQGWRSCHPVSSKCSSDRMTSCTPESDGRAPVRGILERYSRRREGWHP
jgi:hypothetical protein